MHRLLTILSFACLTFAVTMLAPATIALPVALAEPISRPPAQLGQITTPTAAPTEASTASPSETPTLTQTVTSTVTATLTPTLAITETPTVAADQEPTVEVTTTTTVTPAATVTPNATVTPTANITSTSAVTATAAPTSSEPLEGTIIANRSENNARFFVEGVTYDLEPDRSLGLSLPRTSSVLNLYNCDAGTPESQNTCFWDPYLIAQDRFYEIYNASDAEVATRLLLREAGAPPTDQVWVQNRTTETEQVVYRNETYDIPPTTVQEFPVSSGVPAIFYVRSCLTLSGQTVCEWAPKTLDAGVYYAMVAIETAGSTPGSQVTTLDLRPVVAGVELTPTPQATAAGEVDSQPQPPAAAVTGQVVCRLLVPTLNVRSGPGLVYEIIDKVRSGDEPATVAVNGRSVDNGWLTVIPEVAQDGWITADTNFITCDGDLTSLPIIEAPAPPPTPDPSWIVQEPITDAGGDTGAAAPETPGEVVTDTATADEASTEETASAEAQEIPPGQALLMVHNGFEHDIRFTLDQRYRPNPGPSEYDLSPGDSVSIVVFPGEVAFSASSPWSGLSGNAALNLDPDQSLTLWLRFIPDPNGSDWVLVWQ